MLALAVCFGMAASAGEPPRQKWALVIGPGGTPSSSDAVAAQRAFVQLLHVQFGYQQDRVIELYGERATLRELKAAFTKLSKTNPGDTLLIYVLLPYIEAKGGGALQPADGKPDQSWTLLTRSDLEQLAAGLNARATLAILPDCGDGYGSMKKNAPYAQMQRKSQPVSFAALTFCPQGESTGSHAAFARALLNALGDSKASGAPVTASRLASAVRQFGRGLEVTLQRDPGFGDIEFEFIPERGRLDPFIRAVENPSPGPGSTINRPDDRIRAIGALVNAVISEDSVGGADTRDRAGFTILKVGKDPSSPVEVRTRAVRALGEIGYRFAIPDLSSIFSGQSVFPGANGRPPEETVRRAAVEALAQLGGPEAVAPLQAALRDPAEAVRVAAVRAFRTRPENLLSDVVEPLLADSSAAVRAATVQVLGLRQQLTPEAIDALRVLLRDPSPAVRREAVTLLARIEDETSTPEVIRMLHASTEDVSVRQTIAYSLGRTVRPNDEASRKRAVDALEKLMTAEVSPVVREGALWSLGEIGGARAEQILLRGLDDPDPKLREAAADSLGKIGGVPAVKSLTAVLLKDKEAAVRAAAVRALGDIGDANAAIPLLRALEDPDPYVRRAADDALGRLQPGQHESLREALNHPSPRVRAEAIERIGPSPSALELLIRALNDEDYSVRDSAVRVLSSNRDANWIQGLSSALTNDSALVRMGVATALAKTSSPDAVPALTSVLATEENPSVRARIILALASCGRGRPDVSKTIAGTASNPNARIRQAAAEALGAFEDDVATSTLRRLADDDAEEVRMAAIRSLRYVSIK
jgi:HEAT repeat protein